VLGEDTNFGRAAEREGQFLYADAGQFMVVRAHNSNTSPTSVHMGSVGVQKLVYRGIPSEFFCRTKGDNYERNRDLLSDCQSACAHPHHAESFLSQTVTDSELIIVDDGVESVSDLIPVNPRIRYVRLPNCSDTAPKFYGASPAGRLSIGSKRNLCCSMARGEFILHFDDDDWSAPGRMAHQISTICNE